MIAQRISLLNPGQILSYFNYYLVKKENEYFLFKNNNHRIIFAFRQASGDITFLETIEFKSLNKLELFIYLTENLERKSIEHILSECSNIQENEFNDINLSTSTTENVLKRAYFNLKQTDNFKGTNLESINYNRNGTNCVVLFNEKTPVDIITYQENSEDVFSEFGNNFGNNKNILKGEDLYITYNPILIMGVIGTYSTVITKYYVGYYDLIDIIKISEPTKIHIPTTKLYSSVYKLRILLFFWNLLNNNISINFNQSPNNYYVEIIFNFKKDLDTKIIVLNLISEIKNKLNFFTKDFEEVISKGIQKQYEVNYKVETFENNTIGKLTLKNNFNLISFVNDKLIEDINKLSKYQFT